MAVETILDNFNMDMKITRARYQELIIAEKEAETFKRLIASRFKDYRSISFAEIEMLYNIYCETPNLEESEENEND